MSSTKTLNQFLEENPNFYDAVDGWTWDTTSGGFVNTGITQAEKDLIALEFGERYIFDDNKFATRFIIALNQTALRYSNLSRIELTTFDPLVADYMERRQLNSSTRTQTNGREIDTSRNWENDGTNNQTDTPGIVEREHNRHTEGVSHTTNRTASPGVVEVQTNEGRALEKNMPMSTSGYVAAGANGLPTTLDMHNPSAQRGEDSKSTVRRTGSDTEVQIETPNGYNDDDREMHRTGSDTRVGVTHAEGNGTQNVVEQGNANEIIGADNKAIETGRHGITPQSALKEAVNYLKTSNTWIWRRTELNDLFKPVSYDPELAWIYS